MAGCTQGVPEMTVERPGQPPAVALEDDTLQSDMMTINMGPQHPSTHGVLRFIVKADGEVDK